MSQPNDGTFSFANYELNHYIYFSYAFSFTMFLYSTVVVFYFRTFWQKEAGVLFLFTLASHVVAFHSRARLNSLGTNAETESSPLLRPRSTMTERLISLIYLAGMAVIMIYVWMMFRWYVTIGTWKYRVIAALFENVCLFLEIPLMIAIGWWTLKKRRAALSVIRQFDLPQ